MIGEVRRLGAVPEYRRIPFVHFEDKFLYSKIVVWHKSKFLNDLHISSLVVPADR